MFTGIIQVIGKITQVQNKKGTYVLEIDTKGKSSQLKIGDSIAVDGVCLTVEKKSGTKISVSAIPETISKTIIKNYKIKTQVNLELPLRLNDFLHGHLVLGHVDFSSSIISTKNIGEKSKIIVIKVPKVFSKFIVSKGSVTVNGVSLTVSNKGKNVFEVSLIPETLKNTNLANAKKGDSVNIEIDVFARYLSTLISK